MQTLNQHPCSASKERPSIGPEPFRQVPCGTWRPPNREATAFPRRAICATGDGCSRNGGIDEEWGQRDALAGTLRPRNLLNARSIEQVSSSLRAHHPAARPRVPRSPLGVSITDRTSLSSTYATATSPGVIHFHERVCDVRLHFYERLFRDFRTFMSEFEMNRPRLVNETC